MKNKWLIILFMLFLVLIFLSLWITQQSQKAISLSEREILITEQVESRVPPVYPPQVNQAPITALPQGRSGITIIKALSIEPEKESIHASNMADETVNNLSNQNAELSKQDQDIPPAGITRIGKQPTRKETQEMNSSGIVMY